MPTIYHPHLDQDDMDVILEALESELEIDERILQFHQEKDQTPESVEEFLSVVNTQTERIARIKVLRERLTNTGGVHVE